MELTFSWSFSTAAAKNIPSSAATPHSIQRWWSILWVTQIGYSSLVRSTQTLITSNFAMITPEMTTKIAGKRMRMITMPTKEDLIYQKSTFSPKKYKSTWSRRIRANFARQGTKSNSNTTRPMLKNWNWSTRCSSKTLRMGSRKWNPAWDY